jgi:hypothetical protein
MSTRKHLKPSSNPVFNLFRRVMRQIYVPPVLHQLLSSTIAEISTSPLATGTRVPFPAVLADTVLTIGGVLLIWLPIALFLYVVGFRQWPIQGAWALFCLFGGFQALRRALVLRSLQEGDRIVFTTLGIVRDTALARYTVQLLTIGMRIGETRWSARILACLSTAAFLVGVALASGVAQAFIEANSGAESMRPFLDWMANNQHYTAYGPFILIGLLLARFWWYFRVKRISDLEEQETLAVEACAQRETFFAMLFASHRLRRDAPELSAAISSWCARETFSPLVAGRSQLIDRSYRPPADGPDLGVASLRGGAKAPVVHDVTPEDIPNQ